MNEVLVISVSFLLLINRLGSIWGALIIMLLWKVLLVVLERRSVPVNGLRSFLVLVRKCHRHVIATYWVPPRMELLHARSTRQYSGLVELFTAVVNHLKIIVSFRSDRNLAFFHIWMSSYPTWLLGSGIGNLVLTFAALFVVGMSLIDVSLHHLVLLVDNLSGWKCHTLVAFLARFSDTLESRILRSYANVWLQRIHRLRSSHYILSVSHCVCWLVELRSLCEMILLLLWINLEAVWVLESLWLSLRPAWHSGTCSVSWNFSLRLIVKN